MPFLIYLSLTQLFGFDEVKNKRISATNMVSWVETLPPSPSPAFEHLVALFREFPEVSLIKEVTGDDHF